VQAPDRLPLADEDEPPGLLVAAAAGPADGIDDRLEHLVGQLAFGEFANLPRPEQRPDRVARPDGPGRDRFVSHPGTVAEGTPEGRDGRATLRRSPRRV
jgi:hypothetical protein